MRNSGGEVHFQPVTLPRDDQRAAAAVEVDRRSGVAEVLEQHMRRRQGGVAAEIDFRYRGEPAQVIALWRRHEERGFREVVFRGDGLQQDVVEPVRERANGGRVAVEDLAGEGVDLVLVEFHGWSGCKRKAWLGVRAN
jgi:hypothetical protein